MTPLATVYAVFPNPETAERIAEAMVERRLAACANVLSPCRSVYRWNGALQRDAEAPALFKTTAALADALIAAIAAAHPYDVPAAVAWPVTAAHPPYADWVRAEAAGG